MPRHPYLGKQDGRTDGRDEKSLLELPGFQLAAKNYLPVTKVYSLIKFLLSL